MHECGVDGYLIRSMSSLYNGSRACMRLGRRVGKYFEVRKGLRQGCVMSPWLFKNFFDRVARQVNETEMGKGMKLRDDKGGGWEIKKIADNTVFSN